MLGHSGLLKLKATTLQLSCLVIAFTFKCQFKTVDFMCFLISECTLSSQKFSKEGYTVIIIASYYAYKTSLPHRPPPPHQPLLQENS